MSQVTMARADAPRRTVPPLPLVLLVVVAAALCIGMALVLRAPDTVARVTLENPAPVAVNVSVHGRGTGGDLVLGAVPAQGSATHLDVLDQGADWVFTFSAGGVDGGTVRVRREAGRRWLAAGDPAVGHRPRRARLVRSRLSLTDPTTDDDERRGTLVALGASLLAAGLLARVGRRIGLPTIPVFMIAGLLFGPNTPGVQLVDHPDDFALLATLGLILLLFHLGVEFSIHELTSGGRCPPHRARST